MNSIPEHIKKKWRTEKKLMESLGESMGFGRIMQLANECWREKLKKNNMQGGEFVYGPCMALTVPCGCEEDRKQGKSCDWCCGSLRLTEKVKAIKDLHEMELKEGEPVLVTFPNGKTHKARYSGNVHDAICLVIKEEIDKE
jgi:hypothetical protein